MLNSTHPTVMCFGRINEVRTEQPSTKWESVIEVDQKVQRTRYPINYRNVEVVIPTITRGEL